MSYTDRNFTSSAVAKQATVWSPSMHPTATAPFLVFADKTGHVSPTYKHQSRYSAEVEAQRLAKLNPGVSYYVLGSLSLTTATKPEAKTWSLV